jgi:hypothetical protein
MGLRLSVIAVGVLVGSSSALAGSPLVRTLATAHGFGSVTAGVGTDHLRTRLWVQRIGGVGVARGSGYTSCTQAPNGTGQDVMFALTLAPNARANLWRYGGGDSCVVTLKLRGKGRIAIAFRGY